MIDTQQYINLNIRGEISIIVVQVTNIRVNDTKTARIVSIIIVICIVVVYQS
jgi:hypothetical protein